MSYLMMSGITTVKEVICLEKSGKKSGSGLKVNAVLVFKSLKSKGKEINCVNRYTSCWNLYSV